MSEIHRLPARFPCCDVACTHQLEPGVDREVACPRRCGKRWVVRLVPFGEHGQALAGRPVGKVDFRPVPQEASA